MITYYSNFNNISMLVENTSQIRCSNVFGYIVNKYWIHFVLHCSQLIEFFGNYFRLSFSHNHCNKILLTLIFISRLFIFSVCHICVIAKACSTKYGTNIMIH